MSRIPIRARLALAFALATVAVLAGAGLFVYERLDADLTESTDEGLARAGTTLARAPIDANLSAAAPADVEEGFAQLYGANGEVVGSAGTAAGVLSPSQFERAQRETFVFERPVEGVDGATRVRAGPVADGGERGIAYAVGRSTEDRDETLADLVAAFAIGGPVAVLLATLIGLVLARSALRPIESMRTRAERVSLAPGEPLLPLPPVRDEVRRLGETLNEMLVRLRASFERERRFVADAAHELRTPIAVIRAELDAATRAPDAGPLTRESLDQALAECDRLAALAEDLLVLARAADGALPVHAVPVEIAAELEGARVRFAERASATGRAIRVEAPADLQLEADPLRLRQALGNLIDNALRHGAGTVSLGAQRAGEWIEIEVRDEGSGFAASVADRAFDRFTRGDEARSGGGAGLGLAIVRSIVQAHGGTAQVGDSGHGSVVIRLPARSQGDLSSPS